MLCALSGRSGRRGLERQGGYQWLLGCEPPGLLTLLREQVSLNGQARAPAGRGLDTEIGLLTRAPIGEQQLICADALYRGSRGKSDRELAAWKSPSDVRPRRGLHDHCITVALPAERLRYIAILAIQRDVVAEKESRVRSVGDFDVERQRVGRTLRRRSQHDLALGVPVDPAAALRPHLESGRDAEEPPLAGQLHEHPQALRAEETEVAAVGRQEAVDADVSLRQHRMKHTAHPYRRSQRALIRSQMSSGPQQLAMRPQHLELLGPQGYVGIGRVKERQALAALTGFLVAPGRWKEAA